MGISKKNKFMVGDKPQYIGCLTQSNNQLTGVLSTAHVGYNGYLMVSSKWR